jgi:hypothetical protein
VDHLGLGLGMDPAPAPDAFAVPIYEPIFCINTYGQPPWKVLFPANDVLQYVPYEVHYLFGVKDQTQ